MSKKKTPSNNTLFRVLTRLTEIIVLYVLSMFFVTQIVPMLASLTFKLAGGAEAVGSNIGVLFGAWLAPLLFCVLVSVAAYIGLVVYLHRFVGRVNKRFFPTGVDDVDEEQHSTEPLGKAKLVKADDEDDELDEEESEGEPLEEVKDESGEDTTDADTLEEESFKLNRRKRRRKRGARA